MKNFHWDRRTLYRNALFALTLVCFALIVHELFGDHGLLALRRHKKQFESLEQQIQKLQKENQELEQQIKALKSDPKAIEKQAREQLHLARPGEIIYTLPERDSKTPAKTTPDGEGRAK